MSLPSFPSITPPITREDALNQLISSIASEELGMSHILNAEGEKLQYILGTLPGLSGGPATYQEVLDANNSVSDLLNSSMELTFLLKNKLDLAMNAPSILGPTGPSGLTGADGTFQGATGPTGPAGPNGAIGTVGTNGAIGPTGTFAPTSTTTTAGSAANINTLGTILTVPLSGTLTLSLPNAQIFSPDITVSGANSVFTVANAGTYRLSYSVNTTLALLLGTRLLVNGSPLAGSIISPLVSVSNYNNEVEVNLTAGSTISLQFVNTTILPVLVTLISGVGASLMIIRLN